VSDDLDRPRESVHSPKVHAHISQAVIATYAADAAREVDGVYALLGGHFGSLDRRTDPERAAKAVRVSSRGEGVALDVHVLVAWGASIPDVTAQVDSAVRGNLASMVDLDDVDVTVHIDGLAPASAGVG
jgi:uncharacterized alkaline shock family protein YloU